jgi:hypothetical protein
MQMVGLSQLSWQDMSASSTAAMADDRRDGFRGHSSRVARKMARLFMTQSDRLPPSIAALRNVHSITSLGLTNSACGTLRPFIARLMTLTPPLPRNNVPYPHSASVNKTLIVLYRGGVVGERVRVSPITSKQFRQKLKNVKSKKRKTARRSAVFKSASWYESAAMSIGVSAKA